MNNYIIHRDDEELYHFGVKGQKWGTRRYQNEDGSYKPGAEGRYAPDGKPGVNKKKAKDSNKVISSSSEKKKTESEEDDKWTQEDLDKYFGKGYFDTPFSKKKAKNGKKTESELEDEEISRRADAYQKKNPKMSRIDAESAAEDDMIKEARAKRKAEGKEIIFDRWSDKIEESIAKREAKKAEKEKNKKKTESEEDDKWTQEDLDKYFGKGYFDTPFSKKKKSVKHSDFSDYDLYNLGIFDMHLSELKEKNR